MAPKSMAWITAEAAVRPRGRAFVGAIGLVAALWAGGLQAQEQKTIIAHVISTFGELRLPADFPHLLYVNPDAPKGGEIANGRRAPLTA